MNKYYTRACNFYYGTTSKTYIKKKKSIPLNGYNHISFDKLEIIDRKKNKIINIKLGRVTGIEPAASRVTV